MSHFQFVGIILFVVGLVPFTIGRLIHMAYNPGSWDGRILEMARRSWKPKAPVWNLKAYDWSMFTHPKSRWWCLIGAPVGMAGFLLLVFSAFEPGFLALFVGLAVVFFGVLSLVDDKRR